MPTTPNLGIEIPDPSGVPSRKTWVEDPMMSADAKVQAALTALAKRHKSGNATFTAASGTTTSHPVTFVTPFAAAPRVTVDLITATPQGIDVSYGNRTTTGFTIYVYRATGTGTVGVSWTATDLGND